MMKMGSDQDSLLLTVDPSIKYALHHIKRASTCCTADFLTIHIHHPTFPLTILTTSGL